MALILAGSSADFRAIKEEFKSRLAQMEFPEPELQPASATPRRFSNLFREILARQEDNYPTKYAGE